MENLRCACQLAPVLNVIPITVIGEGILLRVLIDGRVVLISRYFLRSNH